MGRRALSDRRLGGNSAFEQMVADHLRAVYRAAVRLAGRTQDAEDLVQETLLRAWRSRHTFQPETNAKTWLRRILHNVNVDRFRAGRRMVPTVSELDGPGSAFAMPRNRYNPLTKRPFNCEEREDVGGDDPWRASAARMLSRKGRGVYGSASISH